MKAKDNYLELSGYRLANRSGVGVCVPGGHDDEPLLWADRNSAAELCLITKQTARIERGRWRASSRMTSACSTCWGMPLSGAMVHYENYPEAGDKVSEDSGTTQPVMDGVRRVLRGGAFNFQPVDRPLGLPLQQPCRTYRNSATVSARPELTPDPLYSFTTYPP